MYAMRTMAVKRVDSACRPTVVDGFIVHTMCTFSMPRNSRFSS